MKKTPILFLFIAIIVWNTDVYSQNVTAVYSDYLGFWSSNTTTNNPINPTNSNSLLAFTVNGNTYSTGVNDATLTTNGVSFIAQQYQALPVSTLPPMPYPSATVIGVGQNYGGAGNVSPVPVTNDIAAYLTDGLHGLDLATGVFNLPSSSQINYSVVGINPTAIGDGIPDILVTQIGQPPAATNSDIFKFTTNTGTTVGNQVVISVGSVPVVGSTTFKFYNPSSSGAPVYNAPLAGNRPLRMVGYDFSAFGITTANYTTVKNFSQIFSGQSDQAFIAYNSNSIVLLQPISGTVFIDPNGGTPDGTGYNGATVTLYDISNNIVATTTTNSSGYYSFPNLVSGNYTVVLTVPTGYHISGSSDGDTNGSTTAIITGSPVTGVNFGINQGNPLPVNLGSIQATINNNLLIVNWQTLSEKNNRYFNIEVSNDGVHFKKIGTAESNAANGNSDTAYDYVFTTNLNSINAMLALSLIAFLGFGRGKNSRRKKLLITLMSIIWLSTFFACSKNNEEVTYTENKTIFVRIAQVDIDGTTSYSKTVRAITE
ncbi:MAG: SdrD B-like domain-containing protein [Niabella sp.]